MSDEEDTAILLSNENFRNQYKEITIVIPIHSSPKKRHEPSSSVIQVSSIVVFLAGFVYGYDMPNVLCYLSEYANTFELTCIYQTLLLVAWAAGGIFALLTVQALKDQFVKKDRRSFMVHSMIMLLLGTVALVFSPYTLLIYYARALIGFSCVLSATSHCVFIGEISDDQWRGFRISLHQFGVAVGVFVCLVIAYFFKSSEYGWRFATALNIIPIVFHLILTISFVPKISVEDRINKDRWSKLQNGDKYSIYAVICILCVITLGEHFSARQSILSYAPTAFIKLGIDPTDVQQSVSITISIVRMICTGISLHIVDKLGRKSTLLMSNFIMMLSALILMVMLYPNGFGDIKMNLVKYGDYCPYFRIVDSTGLFAFGAREQQMQLVNDDMMQIAQDAPPPFPMLPTPLSLISDAESMPYDRNLTPDVLAVIAILVFEAAHALGPATVMWILIVEMVPTENRLPSLTNIIATLWVVDFGVSTNLSIFTSRFSDEIFSLDLFCAGLALCCATNIVIHAVLSETKGKSFEEIYVDIGQNRKIQICAKVLNKIMNIGNKARLCETDQSVKIPGQETVI